MPDQRAIISAYYHGSETTYAFGPFSTEAAIDKFIDNDPNPNKHDQWSVTWFNSPKLYNTGMECGTY